MKEYRGVLISQFEHIPEVSWYNHNFYIGLKRNNKVAHDLLFAESDDDDTTEWFLITENGKQYIGCSLTSNYPEEKIYVL